MIWPLNLAVLYPLREWHRGQVIISGLLLSILTILAVWARRRSPYFFVGWLWFLGTMIPVIGLVQVGVQRMADRYTYIPFIGLFIVVAWGMADISSMLVPTAAVIVSGRAILLAGNNVKSITTVFRC